jgi:hypothetical protein
MAFGTKEELLTFFDQIHVGFTTALAGAVLLVHADCYCVLRKKPPSLMIEPGATSAITLDLSRTIDLLEKDPRIPIAPMNRLCFMAAIVSMYSATEEYCKATEQLDLYKAQPWFHVLRLARHCLGHDMKWRIFPSDKQHLPVTWNGVTISTDLDGVDFSFRVLPPDKLIELFVEVERFVHGLPK